MTVSTLISQQHGGKYEISHCKNPIKLQNKPATFTGYISITIHLLGLLRGNVKKKNSLFVDIVQIGGGEVNSISKKKLQTYFLTKRGEGGGHKGIVG